jgi:membrane protease YdiL (CAAX protease family)
MFVPIARGHIGFVGWYFIGLLAFLGWASFRSRKRMATMPKLPSRARHFTSTILVLSLIFVLSLLVARMERIPLFPRSMPTPLHIGVGLAIAGVLAACMRPLWRQSVAQGDRRIYFFTPSNALERGLWIGVSLVAGIGEEVTYRGVLYVLFLTLTRSPWAAALLSAAWFAAGHAVQSARSMAIIFLFSLIFQGIALRTGALYVAMLAHFVYDVIAGLTYSRLAREMGYQPPGAVGAAAAVPEPAGG